MRADRRRRSCRHHRLRQGQCDRVRGGRAGSSPSSPASPTIWPRRASRCSGRRSAAAQLEGSKGFTKDLCREFDIPTGAYGRFTDAAAAKTYLATQKLPIVIKADGLAAGKGVVIAESWDEANAAVDACFEGAFGAAGAEIVIEEFLDGEEVSFFALCDGEHVLPLATAQDHKRVGDGDTGPNTGGMGAYSPAPVMTPEMTRRTMDEIIRPTVAGMASAAHPSKACCSSAS